MKMFRDMAKSLQRELETVVGEKAKEQQIRESRALARARAKLGQPVDTAETRNIAEQSGLNEGISVCESDRTSDSSSLTNNPNSFTNNPNSLTNNSQTESNSLYKKDLESKQFEINQNCVEGFVNPALDTKVCDRRNYSETEDEQRHSDQCNSEVKDQFGERSSCESDSEPEPHSSIGGLNSRSETSNIPSSPASSDSGTFSSNKPDNLEQSRSIVKESMSSAQLPTNSIQLPMSFRSFNLTSSVASMAADRARLFQNSANDETFGDSSSESEDSCSLETDVL